MPELDVDAARRTLLAAAGPGGRFGHVTRDPVSGELELVLAARGTAVNDVLRALGEVGAGGWVQRLLRSLAGTRGDV